MADCRCRPHDLARSRSGHRRGVPPIPRAFLAAAQRGRRGLSGALVTAALVVPLATCFACSTRPAQPGLLPATSPPVAVAPARASAVRSDTGTAAGEARGMTSCVEPYSLEGLKA